MRNGTLNKSDFDPATLVAWAAGTVAAQVNGTLDEAVALLERREVETSRTLDEIAIEVTERRVRFCA